MTAELLGGGLGAGLWLILRGLFPARPSLAQALAALDRTPPQPSLVGARDSAVEVRGVIARLGAPLARLLGDRGSRFVPSHVARDLRVIEQSPATYAAEILGLSWVLAVLATAVLGVMTTEGVPVPWSIWLGVVLVAGGLGWPAVAGGLRQRAARRRADFGFALSGFVDQVHLGVGAGRTVEEALVTAADSSDSWAFSMLRRTLASARARKETSWTALGRLGAELTVPQLEELAANVDLASRRGGQVLRTLAARADTLRAQRLADARASAHRATQLVTLPLGLMGIGFLLFLLYPALARVFST